MKKLSWLLLCIMSCSASAWAAGSEPFESFFVRPTSECPAFNGDGTAYACAVSNGGVGAKRGFSSIVGTATPSTEALGTMDQDDTLFLCGTFLSVDHDFSGAMFASNIPLRGTSGHPFIIDGNCSAQGNLAKAVIDGEYIEAMGIGMTDASGGGAWTTWKNFIVQRTLETGMTSEFAAEPAGMIISNVQITNIGQGAAAGQQCLEMNSFSFLIDNVLIGPCGNDGIYIGNGSTGTGSGTISNSTIIGVSQILTGGDGIQQEPGGGALKISHVTITKYGSDKACIIAGGLNGKLEIEYVDCSAVPGNGPFNGFTIEGSAPGSYITNCYIHDIPGGLGLFFRSIIAAMPGTFNVYGNVIARVGQGIVLTGADPAGIFKFYHNTIANTTIYGITTGGSWNPGAAQFRNNIVFASSGEQIFVNPSAPEPSVDWDSNYNIFKGTATYEYLSTIYSTLATYSSASGDDVTSQNIDPLFVGTSDYRTMGLSPARNAGLNSGPCADVRGRACYPDHRDIGAHQATGGDFAAPRLPRN